ncbi:MAG: M14 family metallopeptidase [Planctomycetota bacterium]|nr:M14 family metallopeptidase [Planctomycetota bacterium]
MPTSARSRWPASLACLAAVLGALVSPAARAQPNSQLPDLRTVAEASDYRATARHAEVVALLDAIGAAHPNARRASMGASHEGRDLPLLIVSDEPVATAADARRQADERGKVVVFAIGNIHAGEVCGKEALPMLARELLAGEGASTNDILRHVIFVIAPIYNADGNERVSPDNRPGQNGPELGMGVRENAQGFDLNRDFIKLEAPETRALVRFLNAWDPHVFIDCHTTNGSLHRYTITYAGPKCLAGDEEVRAFSRDVMFPRIAGRYGAICAEPTFWYGSFGENVFGNPTEPPPAAAARADVQTWGTFPAEARFGTTYVGLRGRLSILSEAYSYAPYKDRVLRTRDFVRAALGWAAADREAIRAITREADERARSREPATIAIRSRLVPCPGEVTVLGFEKTSPADRASPGAPQDHRAILMDCFEPTATVTRPRAYVVPRDERLAHVVEVLRLHGVRVDDADADAERDGETYVVDSLASASRLFQGHALVRVEATPRRERVAIRKGDFIVPMDQPLANLAAYLLEPSCEDGLTTWNFFDAFLKPGETFPVRRVME